MAFTIKLLSDVSAFLKGTTSIEDALDDVVGSLDDLAKQTEADAAKASGELERKFSKALDEVGDDAKRAGKKIGDDVKDGTRAAGEGMDTLKDEARQSVRETAASFSDVNDALDLVQELAANALGGFGPAGMAAGAAAAVGIGLVKASLDEAKEKADDYVETVHGISEALRDAGGVAGFLADSMQDIVDEKEWFEFWQALPVDRLRLYTDTVRELGLNSSDVFAAMAGDVEAYDRIARDAIGRSTEANMDQVTTFLNGVRTQGRAVNDAKRWNEDYANSSVAAQQRIEEAQRESADRAAAFSSALTANLSVADEGLSAFVHNGKLSLKEWNDELERRAKETKRVREFAVTMEAKLSPEALANLAALPVDTQAEIEKAYRKGSKADRAKIVQNLELEAKTTKVTVDTSGAQTEADKNPVVVPVKASTADATKAGSDAAAAAQTEADKTSNVVELRFKVDSDELQRKVTAAAAQITPPTIYARVKVQKDTP